MLKKTIRILWGLIQLLGMWFGGAMVGKLMFPGSDAMIIPAVIGMVIGIHLCLTTWTKENAA